MESCKYHPVTPSIFNCPSCQEEFCGECVDKSVGGEPRCFICGSHLSFHVTSDNIEPFWRRLEKAFKYPLNKNALIVVVGFSFLSVVINAMPFHGLLLLILNLVLIGSTVNYSFLCLSSTSEGHMQAPNFADAFSGSIGVLIKLFIMVILLGLGLYAITAYVNPMIGAMASVVVIVGLPAILMCFAHTGSVLEAINPFVFVRLIATVGMSYGVMIIFLLIMMSSVTVLHQIIGNELAALSTILQSSVSNYYAIVMFHLMGYMLYQYQDRLGISVSGDDEDAMQMQAPDDVVLAHVNLRLKEGDYNRVDELLRSGLDVSPNSKLLWDKYFEFLYRTERAEGLLKYSDRYFDYLIQTAQTNRLATDYKRVLQVVSNYSPKYPNTRYQIAQACRMSGDSLSAVKLINGMHKAFPNYEKLVAAYSLMTDALNDLPNMAAQASKCSLLLAALKKKFPESQEEHQAPRKAVYDIDAPAPVKQVKVNAVEEKPLDNEAKDLSPIEFKL